MTEIRGLPQQEQAPDPTDEQLFALLGNSKLSTSVKTELEKYFYHPDGWVKRQLVRIFLHIDKTYNLPKRTKAELMTFKANEELIESLWVHLRSDWSKRLKL